MRCMRCSTLQVLGADRRLHNVALDEPMDTIFVRLVRDNSPASTAGLCQGKCHT